MYRFWGILLGSVLLILSSCEKCMKCSYTYTVTSIEQTVNGEEEVVNTYNGFVHNADGSNLDDECYKGDGDFTIDDKYALFADTTSLDNFNYTCTEL